jgi:adenosyl cobinamide kinase/adenosyl cobinamide phosphate guanylyltransferase
MTVLIVGGAFQGKSKIAEKLYTDEQKIYNLHVTVREMLQKGENPMSLLDELRGHVVTCDEIGCGVVPIEQNDERWREAVGRLCCALASEADAVIRVWAGVPQFIKGELK